MSKVKGLFTPPTYRVYIRMGIAPLRLISELLENLLLPLVSTFLFGWQCEGDVEIHLSCAASSDTSAIWFDRLLLNSEKCTWEWSCPLGTLSTFHCQTFLHFHESFIINTRVNYFYCMSILFLPWVALPSHLDEKIQ